MDKTLMLHLLERAVPFLRDEGDKYDDDGSNEPLELARDIESVLASNPPNESAVVPAKTAFDGGAEAADALRATTGEGECSEHVRKQIGRLAQWQLCMSHNESYFGEPAGLVKSVVEELIHAVDPIYPPITPPADPLSGVTISYTTTQARGCPDKDTSWIDRCDDNPPGSLNSPAPDLGKAVDMLLASAPAHMTHRNAAEREAYRLLREARATPTPPPEPTTKARIQRGHLAGVAPERDAVTVETAGFVRMGDDGPYIDWTLEGGISALEVGQELIVSADTLTDDDGAGEVYLHPAEPLRDAGAVGYVDVDGPRELKEGRTGITLWATPMAPRIATPLYTHPAQAQAHKCPHCGSSHVAPTAGNGVGNTHDCLTCHTDFTPTPERDALVARLGELGVPATVQVTRYPFGASVSVHGANPAELLPMEGKSIRIILADDLARVVKENSDG